jgi:NADPH-dependent 2,4-dienoyl-CoA reductase/sulfur reductase-like enzyme
MTTSPEFDVLVAGAGPAGIAAACAASQNGLRIGVIDDNPAAGGQIWRGETENPWLAAFDRVAPEFLGQTRVTDFSRPGVLLATTPAAAVEIRYRKLILATGARELFLPFPGWAQPNVLGAGGLQALVKTGWPVEGKRIIVAGSGPLLLAVAAYLRKQGAIIPLIAEQAPRERVRQFGVALAREPAKLLKAAAFRCSLLGTRYLTGCWPQAVDGRTITLHQGQRTWTEPCDYVACGFGLVPNLELPLLLGCTLEAGFVQVNEWQETSLKDVYCAGEPTGIGGLDLALTTGQIAGYHAARRLEQARSILPARARAVHFKNELQKAFALREELKLLPEPETLVCRCEDVPLGRIREHACWRSAKLQTRCGMGPCQGRICGPALEFLLGWKPDSVRPPIFPAPVEHLSSLLLKSPE